MLGRKVFRDGPVWPKLTGLMPIVWEWLGVPDHTRRGRRSALSEGRKTERERELLSPLLHSFPPILPPCCLIFCCFSSAVTLTFSWLGSPCSQSVFLSLRMTVPPVPFHCCYIGTLAFPHNPYLERGGDRGRFSGRSERESEGGRMKGRAINHENTSMLLPKVSWISGCFALFSYEKDSVQSDIPAQITGRACSCIVKVPLTYWWTQSFRIRHAAIHTSSCTEVQGLKIRFETDGAEHKSMQWNTTMEIISTAINSLLNIGYISRSTI